MTIPSIDGVEIQVLGEGVGNRESKAGDKVSVHYRGTLTNGNKFDASYDRSEPLSFTVGRSQVIRGWDEGLLGMKIGEKRKLTIQPDLAYGAKGFPPVIPPSSVLIFETELVSIQGVKKGD